MSEPISKITQSGLGKLEIYYSFRGEVKSGSNSLANINVSIANNSGVTICNVTSADNGFTPFCPATLLTVINSGGPYTAIAGGINPLKFTVNASGYNPFSIEKSITSPLENVLISLATVDESTPPSQEDDKDEDGGEGEDNKDADGTPNGAPKKDDSDLPDDNNQDVVTEDQDDIPQEPTVVFPNSPTTSDLSAPSSVHGSNFNYVKHLLWIIMLSLLLYFLIKRRKDDKDKKKILRKSANKRKNKK